MALKEKLIEAKSEVEALLAYANTTTGKTDVNLGEAVKTLADGYGKGGGDDKYLIQMITGEFSSDFKIPETVTTVRSRAFYECTKLTSIEFPDSVVELGPYAFSGCSNLGLVELPPYLESIKTYGFYNCTRMTIRELPDSLTSIGSYAFYNCVSLTEVIIPSATNTVSTSAFRACTKLTTVIFRGKPNTIGTGVFTSCSALKDIKVPWSEGEIAGAPWGAPNTTTITYNYTE